MATFVPRGAVRRHPDTVARADHDLAPAEPVVDSAGLGRVPIGGVAVGPELTVGSAFDPAEADADRVSLEVLRRLGRGAEPAPPIRRSARPEVGAEGGALSTETQSAIDRLRGGGQPLPDPTRARMEYAFGTSFADVRVHTGAVARSLSRRIGARAFTTGSDVVLGDTDLADSGADGERVLAHELTHVVQNRGEGALSRIRRLVGFEVELSVPIYDKNVRAPLSPSRPGGPAPSFKLGAFFTGGQAYGTDIGTLPWAGGPGISLTTDHNVVRRRARALYDAIGAASPAAVVGVDYEDLANLEYGTPALDELADGSDAVFQSLATTIDTHVASVMAKNPRTAGTALPTSPSAAVGVPVPELRSWLELDDWDEDEVEAALTALQDEVKWSMYVQATVGVLPTGLTTLYESQADDVPGDGAAGGPLAAIKEIANAVVTMSKAAPAQTFMDDFEQAYDAAHPGGELSRGDLLALTGLLSVATSYAMGRAMGQTSLLASTAKNAVQLLNKMTSMGEMSRAGTTKLMKLRGHDDAAYVIAFVRAAAAWIHTAAQTNRAHWAAPPYSAAVNRDPIYGDEAGLTAVAATERLVLDLLTGSDTADAMGAGTPLTKPDARPAAAGTAGGQRGVPMEMRWIRTKPAAAGQLWPVVKSVLDQTRAANLAHLGEDARAAILARM